MNQIHFTIYGTPQQVGSKTPWIPRRADGSMVEKNCRPVIATMDSNKKSKPWMAAVRAAAGEAYRETLLTGPVRLVVVFHFPRPKAHYRTGKHAGQLRTDAPLWHDKTPDCDKLVRCLADGLTGVIWVDDRQVAMVEASKQWTDRQARAVVTICPLADRGTVEQVSTLFSNHG